MAADNGKGFMLHQGMGTASETNITYTRWAEWILRLSMDLAMNEKGGMRYRTPILTVRNACTPMTEENRAEIKGR